MNIPKVNDYKFYFNVAYNAGSRVSVSKKVDYETRMNIIQKEGAKRFYKSLYNQLSAVIKHFPVVKELNPFYTELLNAVVGIDEYKKNLGAVNWARYMIKKLYYEFRRKKMKLNEFYGRSKSVMEQISEELKFLEKTRKKLIKFPSIKDLPTVLLAGYPNVGKTSLLSKLTTSEPEINSYPFTTKDINVGFLELKNRKIQIIDTPGVLERPVKSMNVIEKKAIIALKHLADIILFLYDTSTSSGYSVKEQEELHKNLKKFFPKAEIITVTNKSELDKSKETNFYISCKTGKGIDKLKNFLIKKLITS